MSHHTICKTFITLSDCNNVRRPSRWISLNFNHVAIVTTPNLPKTMPNLSNHLAALTNAHDIEQLWADHSALLAFYGFDRIIYGFTHVCVHREHAPDPDNFYVRTNAPEDFPLILKAPHFQWALSHSGYRGWSDAECCGFPIGTAGLTLSFRAVSPQAVGAIAMAAEPGLCQKDVERIWKQHGSDLALLNQVAHLKILALPHGGTCKLTLRQREVLAWVGDGKTNQDIAVIMGVTPATVEKHLRLARSALNVETTAQAVLKAGFMNQFC